LTSKGTDAEVKLIDFGLAKEMSESVTRSFLGTRGYLAPEMLQRHNYDKAIDIWALGIIAFVLLCGCLPFDDDSSKISSESAARKKFTLRFPPWASSLSASAKDLLHNLLDVNPKTRSCSPSFCNSFMFISLLTQIHGGTGSESFMGEWQVCPGEQLLTESKYNGYAVLLMKHEHNLFFCFVIVAGERRKEMLKSPMMQAMQNRMNAGATGAGSSGGIGSGFSSNGTNGNQTNSSNSSSTRAGSTNGNSSTGLVRKNSI
jgi:serine/threonine protein kinase